MKPIAMELAVALALAGCATATPVDISADTRSYHVECAAGRKDLCYAKAAQLCPNGFDEVKAKGSPDALPPSPDATAATQGEQTTLLISCK